MKQLSFKNPIGILHIGDPFVLHDKDGKFYLYATSFVNGFKVFSSEDLTNWKEHPCCYKMDENSFGYKDFWAPEVIFYNNKYYMHYTARWKKNDSLRMGVAVSDSPLGPFIDVRNTPMFDFGYAAIDGHVFIDDDNKKYYYYSKDCSENIIGNNHESHIYVAELNENLDALISEPKLVAHPEKPFETLSGDWLWNEGPFVLKHNKKYYLMYSANCYGTNEYCVCYAVAESPVGPFIKPDSNNPLLTYIEGKVSGPGHNSVFKVNNKYITAYHVHTDYNNPNWDRQVFFDKLYFDGDVLKISGPTFGENIVLK